MRWDATDDLLVLIRCNVVATNGLIDMVERGESAFAVASRFASEMEALSYRVRSLSVKLAQSWQQEKGETHIRR